MFARTQAVSGARSSRLAVISPFGSPVGPAPKCASGLDAALTPRRAPQGPYAALDLGTNNCRLLIARPTYEGFRVIDSFSRIVRLGEGLSQAGRLSEAAIARTIGALTVCRDKMRLHGVSRARMIEFLEEVRERIGIQLEIVDRETEAQLAAAGCGALADRNAQSIVLFDIGGGSSEIVWLTGDKKNGAAGASDKTSQRIHAWESLRLGVVTLAEKFGGREVSDDTFAEMTRFVADQLRPFSERVAGEARCAHFHLLGTSGTVTTIAGVHLNLPRYDRRQIDGLWLTSGEVDATIGRLRSMTYAQRSANPCIGHERADLVLAGCAILEAIRQSFPAERIRIADRGLREGMLTQLMSADRGARINAMGH
jgi:exopolyphosphatase/guanosine-5'-triphosphate,3'-diphosphate pyrophosphatase